MSRASQCVATSAAVCVLASALAFPVGASDDQGASTEASTPNATPGSTTRTWDEYTTHLEQPALRFDEVMIQGERVRYVSAAKTLTLQERGEQDYEPRARMFSVTYLRTPEAVDANSVDQDGASLGDISRAYRRQADENRPVTFIFNGGPGSSSVWLHLGLYGPRCVQYADDAGTPGAPPYTVAPNDLSLLDVTDLVFIDPVSTGFSRAVGTTSPSNYHGLEVDIASVGAFIHRWLTETGRWSSPIYLSGESYGTTRAAGLAKHLVDEHGLAVSGITLVSTVLDFGTIRNANDLPYSIFLPALAATARYHDRLEGKLAELSPMEVYQRAEQFTRETLQPALFAGNTLPADRRRAIAEQIAAFTGLTVDEIERRHLELAPFVFRKALLRDEARVIGRFDSRFKGDEPYAAGDYPGFDPSYDVVHANYAQSFNDYVRTGLGYESDLPYEIIANVRPWDYGRSDDGRPVDVSERLADVLNRQPFTRVFVASGLYDLATPPMSFDYTLSQMKLSPDALARVQVEYYEAGHMMYVHRASFEQLSSDLRAWYQAQ